MHLFNAICAIFKIALVARNQKLEKLNKMENNLPRTKFSKKLNKIEHNLPQTKLLKPRSGKIEQNREQFAEPSSVKNDQNKEQSASNQIAETKIWKN